MADLSFLDWPFFEDRHRALRERLLRFLPDRLAAIDDSDDRAACRSIVERLANDRFLDYAVPQAGERLDVRSLCVIRETLAHHHGLADFAFALQGLGSAPITLSGSPELKERYLPGTREGRLIAANATGCLEVFSTPYPESSWQLPWVHSLFGNAPAVATGVAAGTEAAEATGIGREGSGWRLETGSWNVERMETWCSVRFCFL